jgi:hypothetical protein
MSTVDIIESSFFPEVGLSYICSNKPIGNGLLAEHSNDSLHIWLLNGMDSSLLTNYSLTKHILIVNFSKYRIIISL